MVVQRLLPLQPGITQPYSMLATTDVSYSIDSSIMKPSTSTEYKSTLTEENLSKLNHLSQTNVSNGTSRGDLSTSSNDTSNEDCSDNGDDSKYDDRVETCDTVDSEANLADYSASDADQVDSDEEENNRIRQRFDEDPGIQSLMEISLPSPIQMVHSIDECKFSFRTFPMENSNNLPL